MFRADQREQGRYDGGHAIEVAGPGGALQGLGDGTIGQGAVIVAPIGAVLQAVPVRQALREIGMVLRPGPGPKLEELEEAFHGAGLERTPLVELPGEWSRRGGIIDVYPLAGGGPYRVDYFGDEIDSIRLFDPESQRTVDKVEAINLLPAREYPLDRGAISRFQMNWYEAFEVDPREPLRFSLTPLPSRAGSSRPTMALGLVLGVACLAFLLAPFSGEQSEAAPEAESESERSERNDRHHDADKGQCDATRLPCK